MGKILHLLTRIIFCIICNLSDSQKTQVFWGQYCTLTKASKFFHKLAKFVLYHWNKNQGATCAATVNAFPVRWIAPFKPYLFWTHEYSPLFLSIKRAHQQSSCENCLCNGKLPRNTPTTNGATCFQWIGFPVSLKLLVNICKYNI